MTLDAILSTVVCSLIALALYWFGSEDQRAATLDEIAARCASRASAIRYRKEMRGRWRERIAATVDRGLQVEVIRKERGK